MSVKLYLLCALLCLYLNTSDGIMGGAQASPPQPDAAVVFVQRHGRSARLEGLKDERLGYYSFLGIRFAEPPLGQRRFLRPERRLLSGELTAVRPCQSCVQPDPRQSGKIIGGEDCLCLNVFAPKMPENESGSPVIFFIHGGNYKSGSASYYGGQHLVQKDTILVTTQYRLGSLGFLSTGERDATGNAGLFDLYAALQWVRDYIEFFGGDPSRIVVMGQGSGGSAASLLGLSTEGRDAHGVVALSGAPLSPAAVRNESEKHAAAIAAATNCPLKPVERLIICLRKISVEKIVQGDQKIKMDGVDTEKFLEDISGKSGTGAGVEGKDDLRGLPTLVSETPANSLEHKSQRAPLLTGVTSAETSRAIYGKYSSFLKNKLSSTRDFIKKELVGGLKGLVSGVQGLLPVEKVMGAVPGLPVADYYQALFDNSLDAVDGLVQVAEATTDALFNFPAYQSVSQWSKAAPAYLYNFEYNGNLTKGAHFLPGVSLADPKGSEEELSERAATGPSHGDELAYIFEPLNEDGQAIDTKVTEADAKVRDSFVNLLSKFAHDFSPLENNTSSQTPFKFSDENDSFIRIGETVTVDKNFRFCQMGLWGNMADRITGALCKNIFGNLVNQLKLSKLTNAVTTLPLIPNLMRESKKKSKTTSKPVIPIHLPFGF